MKKKGKGYSYKSVGAKVKGSRIGKRRKKGY